MNRESSTNFWLFLEVLARRRRLIFTMVVLAAIVSTIVSLLLPEWYEADALLLPREEVGVSLGGTVPLTKVTSITSGIELPVRVTPSDVYARMLKSRAIVDRVIEKLDLKAHYRVSSMYKARKTIIKHADFRVTDEGLVKITVEDRNPQIASDMANAFVDALNLLNQQIVSQRARQSREFIENRLAAVKQELDAARQDLEQFQTTNRALDFDEQTRLAMEQATDLKIEMSKIDIEIGLGQQVLGAKNPELIEKKRQRRAIQKQLDKLEYGTGDSSYFSLPLASIPGLKGEYGVLYSRVQVAETVYMALLELFEQAKIQEDTRSVPLSVVDRAVVPRVRSRPQRTLIVVGSTVCAFIVAVLLACFLEHLKRLGEGRPEDYRKALSFVDAYFGWLPGVRRTSRK